MDPVRNRLVLDRAHSGQGGFHRDFSALHDAPLRVINGNVVLRYLVDASSIEVLAQGGETSVTELIFPTAGPRGLTITSDGETPYVSAITINALTSARRSDWLPGSWAIQGAAQRTLGNRYTMEREPSSETPDKLIVVDNWFEELKTKSRR